MMPAPSMCCGGLERGRAAGCGAYLSSLGLSPRDQYDAQGNIFDRAIIGVRLSRAILDWIRGGALASRAGALGVAELEVLYQRVRREVEAEGIPAEAVGIPLDVQAAAARGRGGPAAPCGAASHQQQQQQQQPAAEDGRGAQ